MSRDLEEVNVSIAVATDPERAFHIFTQEIDLWWQRSSVYRTGKGNSLRIEPFVGGRFLDIHATNGQMREVGRVQTWEPGQVFCVEWQGSNFAEHEKTMVEVRFTPEAAGTRVAIRHWGWEVLPAEHPARHGQTGAAFVHFQSTWWAGLLTACQRYVAEQT